MNRYSVVYTKNIREIVLLRSSGCFWKKCRFCDYHKDFSPNTAENFKLNKEVLDLVTGKFDKLEVINSGSFKELDPSTIFYIKLICLKRKITSIYFESHYHYKDDINSFKKEFEDIGVQCFVKIGIETFDYEFREKTLNKGISDFRPNIISKNFDDCCLLFGIKGQTLSSMQKDIKLALKYFNRVCINIMVDNNMPVKPDQAVIELFMKELYPIYNVYERIDILTNNTDFGVGNQTN